MYCKTDKSKQLYQWNEMMQYTTTEGTQGICPGGWHLPTDAHWSGLTSSLAGQSVAGGKMKETGHAHWTAPNTGASNSSGFKALPGGAKNYIGGTFGDLTNIGFFWSSSQNFSTSSWVRQLGYNTAAADRIDYMKTFGFSVRCIRN
ncbi:MAG: hypothetical protein NTY96_05965 [Bacteroidetes bacterium]|nr:hypothetical protein [Bacteroidota bacterium]